MFNRQSHTHTPPLRRNTQSNAQSSRFSGWALDDDVENTHLQNQEATDHGIPPMPPTPSRPTRQPREPRQSRQPLPHPPPIVENTSEETNTWNNFSTGWLNTYDWGLPPSQPWSAGWDANLDHSVPETPVAHTPVEETPAAHTPASETPTSETPASEPTPQEHQTTSYLFSRDYYDGELSTRRYNHPSHGRINYITIEDVFEYITLGRTISDSYFDELTSYIRREVPTEYTRIREEITFHGRVYEREVPLYSWEQYGQLAKCCLEWALSNPEKLSR